MSIHTMGVVMGVTFVLLGLWLVLGPIRPHRDSELGKLAGAARVLAQVMVAGSGVFTIVFGVAFVVNDLDIAGLDIWVFGALYLGVAALTVLVGLAMTVRRLFVGGRS